MNPWVGISLMPEADFIEAALPLFQSGEIDVIEWSFDTIRSGSKEPQWLSLLLSEYSKRGRLIGHGVRYSLLKGLWDGNQGKWLKQLAIEVKKYNYRHVTEHFGFMSSDDFHKGTPLPVPFNKTTLAIGQDRLKRLQNISQLPIGIENLAFAFSNKQIKEQGEFLEKLLEPVNGFLILDLHNIWCQSHNFKVDALKLIKSYPLHKVKEIHISGGSWATVKTSKNKVRRDTHDEAVPKEVFELLKEALPFCENVEYVIFERLGNTIKTEKDKLQFVKDFKQIKKIVSSQRKKAESPTEKIKRKKIDHKVPLKPLQDNILRKEQQFIIDTLFANKDVDKTIQLLQTKQITGWQPALWTDYMVETAMVLIKKWA
ncbi:MAG: DUF692 family protein [Bacteroidetes bacterium]|nr:DUF692 family protein [Bacteroidota bacterium]